MKSTELAGHKSGFYAPGRDKTVAALAGIIPSVMVLCGR
jgi:hypothetical protein